MNEPPSRDPVAPAVGVTAHGPASGVPLPPPPPLPVLAPPLAPPPTHPAAGLVVAAWLAGRAHGRVHGLAPSRVAAGPDRRAGGRWPNRRAARGRRGHRRDRPPRTRHRGAPGRGHVPLQPRRNRRSRHRPGSGAGAAAGDRDARADGGGGASLPRWRPAAGGHGRGRGVRRIRDGRGQAPVGHGGAQVGPLSIRPMRRTILVALAAAIAGAVVLAIGQGVLWFAASEPAIRAGAWLAIGGSIALIAAAALLPVVFRGTDRRLTEASRAAEGGPVVDPGRRNVVVAPLLAVAIARVHGACVRHQRRGCRAGGVRRRARLVVRPRPRAGRS